MDHVYQKNRYNTQENNLFNQPCIVNHWCCYIDQIIGVLYGHYIYPPLFSCLWSCLSTWPMHPLMNWDGCEYMYEWLEFMVHYTPPKTKVSQFSSIYPWKIHGVLYGQYVCDPLVWLLMQWCINITHEPIDELIGVSTHAWIIGAHGSSHTTQGKG